MDTTADALPPPGGTSLSPSPPIQLPGNADMNTIADSSTAGLGPTNLLSPSLSGSVLLSPCPPVQSPTREDTTDHSITEDALGRTSEIPSQRPRSLHDNTGYDPSAVLSSPVCMPAKDPIRSRSSTPTRETSPARPLLGCAGNHAFDLTGVHGDFISEDICSYWGSVPGGEGWAALVRSYLKLEAIPSTKGVSSVLTDPLL